MQPNLKNSSCRPHQAVTINEQPTAGTVHSLPTGPPANPERATGADAVEQAPRPLASPQQLRAELAKRLGQGDSLDSVECELIAPSRLSEEQQSALWLYGWSLWALERRRAGFPDISDRTRRGLACRGRQRR
jgi:hypothetical protein